MKYNFHIDIYNKNLKSVYDPRLSKDEKREVLNYFLAYKSEVINHSDDCPQKVEDAILHLTWSLNHTSNDENNSKHNPYAHPMRNPILVTIIGGILVLIIWQFISPYFPN